MERRLSVLRINGNMPSKGSVQLCHPTGVGDEWAGRADTIISPRGGWGLMQQCKYFMIQKRFWGKLCFLFVKFRYNRTSLAQFALILFYEYANKQ